MLTGFTQLSIVAFTINTYGNGPLSQPIFAVVHPVIFFPEMSVTVGLLQIIQGAIGISRSLNKQQHQGNNMWCPALCLFKYICMMSRQILSQLTYAPGDTASAAAPTLGCIYFGMAFMPAFLECKLNNAPDSLKSYYCTDMEKNDIALEMESSLISNVDNV